MARDYFGDRDAEADEAQWGPQADRAHRWALQSLVRDQKAEPSQLGRAKQYGRLLGHSGGQQHGPLMKYETKDQVGRWVGG